MRNIKRIPLAERLRTVGNENFHPLYNIFIDNFFEALANVDNRFDGIYAKEIRMNDINENGAISTIAGYIFRSQYLPVDKEMVRYRILIEPFSWYYYNRNGGKL